MGGHPGQVLPGHLVGQQCSSTVGNTSIITIETTSSGENTSSNTVENTRSGENTSSITVENTSSGKNTSRNIMGKSAKRGEVGANYAEIRTICDKILLVGGAEG